MGQLLKIGELASMFQLDIQTLRYYDRIGLLTPRVRDDHTNWRYYEFEQIYQLATIRYLRSVGCSVEYIQRFLKEGNLASTVEQLRMQSARLKEKYENILQMDRVLQAKLTFLEKEMLQVPADKDQFKVETCAQRYYMDMGQEAELYHHTLFYYYPTMAFYRDRDISFGALLFNAEPSAIHTVNGQWKLQTIPAGRYLSMYYIGPYQEIWDTLALFRKQNEYELEQTIVCTNVVDLFVESDPRRFVTKVQARIKEPTDFQE